MLKKDFKNGLDAVDELSDMEVKKELILEGKKDLEQDTYEHIREILIDNSFLKKLFQEVFVAESEAKKRAALTLVEINTPQSIDYAISLIYDQDQELKESLIKALSNLENPKITPTFINYLEVCNDSLTIENLKQAILNRGSEAVNQLLEILENASGVDLNLVVELLGEIDDDRVIDPLINILYNHQESEVRVAAAKSLYQHQTDKVFKALICKTDDKDCNVRAQVAKLLGGFKNYNVIPALYKMLEDDSGIVRNNAAESLFKLGEKGIKYLILAEGKGIASNEIKRILKSLDTSELIKIIRETYNDKELIKKSEKITKLNIKEEVIN